MCHEAHMALTFSFHSLKFVVRPDSSLPWLPTNWPPFFFIHPPSCCFGSAISLHSNAVTQCSSLSLLIVCPIQFHIWRLISSPALFTPLWSSSFVAVGPPILRMGFSPCISIRRRPVSLLPVISLAIPTSPLLIRWPKTVNSFFQELDFQNHTKNLLIYLFAD